VPTKLGTDTDWLFVSAGYVHSMGLKLDGSLRIWGKNDQGQLGDGTVINRSLPTLIPSAVPFQKIKASRVHSLAIKDDGTLWSWGNNDFGQLGDNTIIYKSNPTKIGTDTNWQSISGAGFHSVAQKTTGTIWTWGRNSSGQLGDNTLIDKKVPMQIGTATNWSNLQAGIYYTLARSTIGFFTYLSTWGKNDYGQLGDGTLINKSVPTSVYSCNILGLGVENTAENNFTVYPNPTKSILMIQNNTNTKIKKIKIIDSSGKIVKEEKEQYNSINVENLPAGVYHLQILSDGKPIQKKFIKE